MTAYVRHPAIAGNTIGRASSNHLGGMTAIRYAVGGGRRRAKVVVEPSAAAGLAAVLAGLIHETRIGIVLSGGNANLSLLAS